jgi:hypothetical protein
VRIGSFRFGNAEGCQAIDLRPLRAVRDQLRVTITRRRFGRLTDAAESWSRVSIIARVEAGSEGTDTRFIVTNLEGGRRDCGGTGEAGAQRP